MTTRVLVAGLGDTGVLCAIGLARGRHGRDVEVVAVSPKPGLVSGQELGLRLARPEAWARDYRIGYRRFRGLDRVRIVHGLLHGVDLDARVVTIHDAEGRALTERYDVLVIATGVGNGFWRRPDLQSDDDVDAALDDAHRRLAGAGSVAVLGGGAAAISSALNLAVAVPDRRVDLYFPGDRALPQHHRRVWDAVRTRLERHGVVLHPGHRAVVPDGFDCDAITAGPVAWSTGQPPAEADAVLWTIGRVRPHTGWLPDAILDHDGFVRVGPELQVPERPEVFAIGDVAATDPLRTSARNAGHVVLIRNVRAFLAGKPLRAYRSPRRRWGSVLGPQDDGLVVFTATGRGVRIPARVVAGVLQPLVVRRGIYGGVRRS